MTMLRSFSWQCGINRFVRQSLSSSALAVEAPDLPRASGYSLKPGHPSPGRPILLRPSITRHRKYRNMNRFSFDYAFRPRLRCRTNPGRINLAQEPLDFRRAGFSPAFSLLMPTSSLPRAPPWFPPQLRRTGNAPLPLSPKRQSAASAHGLSPVIFSVQARLTSELSLIHISEPTRPY